MRQTAAASSREESEQPAVTITERFEVVVIGAGQAGLAVGYQLAKRGVPFVILEARDRVGDIWRSRWDSLRLFTPARYDALPGMPFPAPGHTFPSRDQMAEYLESYAQRMKLTVRTGVNVDGLWPSHEEQGGFIITAGDRRFEAAQVVVATGAQDQPRMPEFAGQLNPRIRQLHSSEYKNTSQLQEGGVLVVGAGNSGAEIALETVREHSTILSGRDPGTVPFRIETRKARVIMRGLWFVANHVLTLNTPFGRKVGPFVRSGHGGPLVRVKLSDLQTAGVERTFARTVGVRDGLPLLDDGQVVRVQNVIWCTGFCNDFEWIRLSVVSDDGYPQLQRGVVPSAPGLYFIGLPFLHSFGSMLVGGVGRDAAYVAGKIASLAREEHRFSTSRAINATR
jgi:putative flavoprotein involved in K+ transport